MKKPSFLIISLALAAVILSACVLPFWPTTPTAVPEGTPNATLTALFDVNTVIMPTNTQPVIATTIIELPTVDLSTATYTPEPTITSTLAPSETPTETTIPSATNAATAAPSMRYNAQMAAMYLSTAPVQDGTYAEWVDKTNKYTMPYFTWGQANWVSHDDLEGVYAVAWDYDNLYIGVKITDENYTQTNSGDQIYVGDAIEILLDTDLLGDFYTTTYTSDDYHLGLSAGNASAGLAPEAYLWNPSSVKGYRTQVKVSTQFESGPIYRIEAAIPWSMFGVTPAPGKRFGFAICVDDNDNVTDYDYVTMMSSANGLAVFNPTTWGELVLIK
jgi:hypothetical protein